MVFEGDVPANAYEVRLSDAGQLVWIEHRNGWRIAGCSESLDLPGNAVA